MKRENRSAKSWRQKPRKLQNRKTTNIKNKYKDAREIYIAYIGVFTFQAKLNNPLNRPASLVYFPVTFCFFFVNFIYPLSLSSILTQPRETLLNKLLSGFPFGYDGNSRSLQLLESSNFFFLYVKK